MIKLRAGWLSVRCRDYEEAKHFSYHWRVGCPNKGGVSFRTIYGEIFISASYFLGFKLFHFCSPKIKPGPNWPVSAAVTGTYHDAVFWCFINVSNWWCIWSHYSAFAITPCFGDKSVNCWLTAVSFETRKQLLEKNKLKLPFSSRQTTALTSMSDPSDWMMRMTITIGMQTMEERARTQPRPIAQSGYV